MLATQSTLTRRIIPCLDVRNGRVVKGTRFANHQDLGGIEALAERYAQSGADELVFYDISASPEGRCVDVAWVTKVSRLLNIPFCVAGGIRTVAQARAVLHAGADKISINSPALERPELITEIAQEFGVQCVVVGVDSLKDDDGQWRVRQYTGSVHTSKALSKTTQDWVVEAQARGAGEIVLNCMGSDGVKNGYDIEQLACIRANCHVPLIASGGAGSLSHFVQVFQQADVDGALAASVFHRGEIQIGALKAHLQKHGIAIRPSEPNT